MISATARLPMRCAQPPRPARAPSEIAVAATEWTVKGRDAEWQARQFAIAARETVFRSDELKSKKDDSNGPATCTAAARGRRLPPSAG